MIIPEEQDGKQDYSTMNSREDILKTNVSTGKTSVIKENEITKSRVIVDIREFRSLLPSLLHKRGIHIEPATIEVGDYILTPDMCVERKSLNDLIESISNGRLYNQCNAMCRYYKIPILLIEFDLNKPFNLNVYILVLFETNV